MNSDELSVYADQLQIEGDIRGEILALELLDPQRQRPELVARHHALMIQWLGAEPLGWHGVRFKHGFVACRSADLARVLATPAAPFLRAVTIAGSNTEVTGALRLLAAAPRPWLARLTITVGRRWDRRPARPYALVDHDLARALVTATPALDLLDVTGTRVFDDLPHPAVQRLRVFGHDAIGALAEGGAAFPAARSLFFAFTNDPDGRIAFGEHGLPNTLLARRTLPALTALDLSANALQREWDHRHIALFELIAELGVLPYLEHLRVPPVSSDAEREALAHVRLLSKVAVEDTVDHLRPLHDELEPYHQLVVLGELPGTEHTISLRRLGELVAAAWPMFDDDDRETWRALWRALHEVPVEPEDYWNYEQLPSTPVPRALARAGFAALGDRVDDDHAIALVADALVAAPARDVRVRRPI